MKLDISKAQLKKMLSEQFPQWKNLAISPVSTSGWDNNTFHIGDTMLARLPSAAEYAHQVEKEQHWLPTLAPLLPLQIPSPLAMGKPSKIYPYPWSIYRWIEGETLAAMNTFSLDQCAIDLAQFLLTLQNIDTHGAPRPGAHNFYRGGDLAIYDAQTQAALERLKGKIDTDLAGNIWQSAIATSWEQAAVWVHGDISPGNLLVKDGKLSAVIDFGLIAAGDPACDLAIAWTLFNDKSRELFRQALHVDDTTWLRGTAWALWKALIIVSGISSSNAVETRQSSQVLDEILCAYQQKRLT